MLAPSSLTLAAFAATLLAAVAPLARAELRQGPTGVEYAKRFSPSNGPGCFYTCPNFNPPESDVMSGDSSPNDVAGVEIEGGATTVCTYTYNSDVDSTVPYTHECVYDSVGGQLLNLEEAGCFLRASASIGGTTCNLGRRRRTLTKLEQVIRARQYQPKRLAAVVN